MRFARTSREAFGEWAQPWQFPEQEPKGNWLWMIVPVLTMAMIAAWMS